MSLLQACKPFLWISAIHLAGVYSSEYCWKIEKATKFGTVIVELHNYRPTLYFIHEYIVKFPIVQLGRIFNKLGLWGREYRGKGQDYWGVGSKNKEFTYHRHFLIRLYKPFKILTKKSSSDRYLDAPRPLSCPQWWTSPAR